MSSFEGCIHIHPLVFSHLEDPLSALAGIDQGLHLGLVIDPGVYNMIPSKPEPVVAKDPRPSETVIGSLHSILCLTRQLLPSSRVTRRTYRPGCFRVHHPVDVDANKLPRRDKSFLFYVMHGKDLFTQGHPSPPMRALSDSHWG